MVHAEARSRGGGVVVDDAANALPQGRAPEVEEEAHRLALGDAAVADCVVERIKRWTFPKPVGGGVVDVTFPWIFKTAGE